MRIRVGFGFDVHQLKEGLDFWLGGIIIPHTKGAIGHSDADVLLHAITDSILGVINKGDIGSVFPPSDKKWKNADSSIFLKHASKLLQNEKGKINNIDAIIICEKPKISDYSAKMKNNIAKILNINDK